MSETDVYQKIQTLCAERGISITQLASSIGVSSATASGWKTGAKPRPSTIKKIADYFTVPIDFFLSGESLTTTVAKNNGIIGHTHAPVTIINGSEKILTSNELELLNIFGELNAICQAKVLVYANELRDGLKAGQ